FQVGAATVKGETSSQGLPTTTGFAAREAIAMLRKHNIAAAPLLLRAGLSEHGLAQAADESGGVPLRVSADRIHDALYVECRERAEREAFPTTAIIDSQSVKSTEKGGLTTPHGYDAGKKIKGKKRHILVDTQGLLLHALVHSADIQDRDGGVLVMATLFGAYPFLLKLYADAGYQG